MFLKWRRAYGKGETSRDLKGGGQAKEMKINNH